MNHRCFKISTRIPEKNFLKGSDDIGDHFYHLRRMGAPLITHSSKTRNDRTLQFVLLDRAEIFMNHLYLFKIGTPILGKNLLKEKNDVGGHIYHHWDMGAPLIAYSSQIKYDRNLQFVFLNRAENVVYESSVFFLNQHTDTRD